MEEKEGTPEAQDGAPKRENYTLKEMLEKERRGELDDLNTEEVREFAAYARFKAQTEAEIEASRQLDAIHEHFRNEYRQLKEQFNDKLADIEREGIVNSFLATLKEIDNEQG